MFAVIKKITEKIAARWLFLIAVCLLYVVLGLFNSQLAIAGLRTFLSLLKKILPVLAIVFGLLFFSSLLIETKTIVRYLGKESKRRGWLIAVIGGIISAGPIYLWYPLLSDLRDKGMREALIATFLYNRAVKIPLLPMMILYLGIKPVVILSAYMILFSVLNGYIVEAVLSKRR